MFKYLDSIIKGINQVVKYASLAVVIISILAFSAEKLEEWKNSNDPDKKVIK
jgi:hypothetical protein